MSHTNISQFQPNGTARTNLINLIFTSIHPNISVVRIPQAYPSNSSWTPQQGGLFRDFELSFVGCRQEQGEVNRAGYGVGFRLGFSIFFSLSTPYQLVRSLFKPLFSFSGSFRICTQCQTSNNYLTSQPGVIRGQINRPESDLCCLF